MNKEVLMAVILGLLIVLSAVQAVQLNGLKGQSVSPGPAIQAPGDDMHTENVNVKTQPAMVGGC